MKTLIYSLMLLIATVFIFSCAPCPECPDGPDDEFTPNLKDTISESRYNTWVNNWSQNGKDYIQHQDTLLKYFTMPKIDLTEFLAHPGTGRDTTAAARFVLGMEISGTDTIPHLMLVGANSAGQSMTDASKGQYIYDVTKPCPSSCGLSSLPK